MEVAFVVMYEIGSAYCYNVISYNTYNVTLSHEYRFKRIGCR